MSKIEAIIEICRELHNEKPSPTSFKRSIKAAQALGLTKDETLSLLTRLEFCDCDGKPYQTDICDLLMAFIAKPEVTKTISATFVPPSEPNDGMNQRNMAKLFKALKLDEFQGKLTAIKEVRAMLGVGLKEAKDLVEQHYYNA